ncbi:MAG: outer membrane protein assembly factor BamA [Pseudolabrys sp.]
MGRGVRVVRGLALSCVVLGGLLFGAAVVTVASSGAAVAQTVSSIVVEGNRRVEADTVRSYFKPGPGGQLDASRIDDALKALYATGLFQDVHINRAGGHVVVTVVENPVINKVAFEGNKKAKDKQLTAEVQSKPRGTFSRPTVQADVQRIVEIYHRSGRYDVTVTPQIIELPNNRVNLVFEIKEGEKTGVKQIIFVGNHAYSSGRLKDVIKTSESNWLSFLQTTDIYDPDRIESDRDLLRKFYLSHGYADVRIVSAVGEYDPSKKGFTITYTIDEGAQYHVGTVNVISNVQAIDPSVLRSKVRLSAGNVYNADLVEKSVEAMTIEAAKRGYAFATVHPRGDRNAETKIINLAFVVEEGVRAYIERINIRGNTRTRDYVIRREFDIGEGDAYNQALINRAERRLKNLNFFKTVKITSEPGSAPDRVIVNVNVEEIPTGEFSVGGGYSTSDGFLAEVSVTERNLFGRGQLGRVAVQYGQYARGIQLSFVEPYLFGYRLAGGIDLFYKQTLANSYLSYDTSTLGTTLKLGIALTEELSIQPRYSIYRQEISLPDYLNNCISDPDSLSHVPPGTGVTPNSACFQDGEASLPIRIELSGGPTVTSLVGYTLTYNTLDNNKNPTSGFYGELSQDFAGVGGDVNFMRTTAEARNYYEVFPDVVGVAKLQGGNITGWGGNDVRALDHFQMGPNLVRGFQPAGIGPRDLTSPTQDALGGTLYWGGSVELQTPLYFLPKEIGIKLAAFADAGSLWNYEGPTTWSVTGETLQVGDDKLIRSSVGIGLIWDSPLGPLRFDFAMPVTKASYDRTQWFRFSGGTKF